MIRIFESIQGDNEGMVKKLNEWSDLFTVINVHSALPAMTNLGQPTILFIIEFQFETEQKRNLFEIALRGKPVQKLVAIKE